MENQYSRRKSKIFSKTLSKVSFMVDLVTKTLHFEEDKKIQRFLKDNKTLKSFSLKM